MLLLALVAIPPPTALGLQTGGHSRANRRVQFFYKGKKKKLIPACQTRCTTLHYFVVYVKESWGYWTINEQDLHKVLTKIVVTTTAMMVTSIIDLVNFV